MVRARQKLVMLLPSRGRAEVMAMTFGGRESGPGSIRKVRMLRSDSAKAEKGCSMM